MGNKLKIKLLEPNAVLPKYQTNGSAGFDLHSTENITIKSNEHKLVSTGLSFSFSNEYEVQLRPRSGLALKNGITILNSPATIDSDYRGEVKVLLINHSKEDFNISIGDRIAQAVFCKVEKAEIEVVDSLDETQRGSGGFGSTGI